MISLDGYIFQPDIIIFQFRDKLKKLRELTDYQGRCKKLRERLEQTTMDHMQKTGSVTVKEFIILSHIK